MRRADESAWPELTLSEWDDTRHALHMWTQMVGKIRLAYPGGVPNCPDWVQKMAHSHEVSSCGFWLGDGAEATFYAYAYPEPPRFAEWHVEPAAASYDPKFREFVLPYAEVRAARDPDATLLDFFQSTHEGAAELAGWDRGALEKGASSE